MATIHNKSPLLLIASGPDLAAMPTLQGIISKYFNKTCPCATTLITTRSGLAIEAAKHSTTLIATTSFTIFKLAAPHLDGTANDNYGTVISFDGLRGAKLRIIFLPPLKIQFSQNHGVFLLDHYLSKLAKGGVLKKDRFSWEFVTPSNLNSIATMVNNNSFLVAVDIETTKQDLRITSCAYTAGFTSESGSVYTATYVVMCTPENYPFCLDAIGVLNQTLPPKVMQNGQYDATYFCRYNVPLQNWLYDTYNFFHCLYPELPKDLAYMSSFFLDNYIYWKDEAGTNLYEYNGKDTHNTFWLWLAQVHYAPDYAIQNYLIEFPVVFPALTCALEGFACDETIKSELHAQESAVRDTAKSDLGLLLSEPNFNPASPKQVSEMFHALGYTVAQGTDKKEMAKFSETNILYEPVAELIKTYRTAAKAVSTYFEVVLLNGRLMYSTDPAGTETGRAASKSSALWCGANIQNQPPYARKMFHADPGFVLGAVDKAQSEAYCTGYIAQDLKLIETVTTSPDFHCQNASMFFGIPFTQLYDVVTGKKLNKMIRDIAKKVNHGANYNMGAEVLLETMGTKAVIAAKLLLKLHSAWTLRRVCQYLLECFDKTYVRVRGKWQEETILEIIRTGKLSLECVGWTRRTFLRPQKTKPDLNAAMAHKPQCLSVILVNKAYVRILHELQLGKYAGKFRLKAQVHDEIVFQATPDIMDVAIQEVADIMVIPTVVNGRLMTIPSTKITGHYWSDLKD